MSTRGAGMTWVGRAIRRLEDPALVQGQGRFTADLTAAHYVRFIRSPVAAGTIKKIDAPPGATLVSAADLTGVKPILPMLSKFSYKPVAQSGRRRPIRSIANATKCHSGLRIRQSIR